MPRNTGPDKTVVDAVLERAQYSCEACGAMVGDRRGFDYSVHHRRPRGMGGTRRFGTNLPSNLMILCGSANTGCHGLVESNRFAALARGFLVQQHEDPSMVMVKVGGSWIYLGNDCTYRAAP